MISKDLIAYLECRAAELSQSGSLRLKTMWAGPAVALTKLKENNVSMPTRENNDRSDFETCPLPHCAKKFQAFRLQHGQKFRAL